MHSNQRRASSRLKSHGDATHRVHHFKYPDSQLTSEIETDTETTFSDLGKERELRHQAEAQSVRLAGLLEKAVTQFEKEEPPQQTDTNATSAQQRIIQELSSKASEIELKLEKLKVRDGSTHLSSRIAAISEQLCQLESRPIETANQIGDSVSELDNQLERIEEGTNRIAAKNRNVPRRWSSQVSLDSAMTTPDFVRHRFSLTPDKTSGRMATLQMELQTTQHVKEELRGQLEQMLSYARSLECELRNYRTDSDTATANREQLQRELTAEKQRVSELTTLLTREKENRCHYESISKKLQQKLRICQQEALQHKTDSERALRESIDIRGEFERRMLERESEIDSIYREITRDNSELKFQLEDERSRMRSLRELQLEMGDRYRCEMADLSSTKELLIKEKNNFEKINKESKVNNQEIEVLHEYLQNQQNEIQLLKNDNSAVLKATGTEIDLLIYSYGSKHRIPQFTSGTLEGLETDPRKWITDVLAKLKWLQAELRATRHRDTFGVSTQ